MSHNSKGTIQDNKNKEDVLIIAHGKDDFNGYMWIDKERGSRIV